MADPFLDGKPMKLSKNGSDVGFFFFFSSFHFMTVLAAAFCTACRRLICFGAVPTEGYCSSQDLTKSDSNAACSFVGDVCMYYPSPANPPYKCVIN